MTEDTENIIAQVAREEGKSEEEIKKILEMGDMIFGDLL